MLAKCAKCQHVFTTDHYGPNSCPSCGAELMLSAPPGAGGPPVEPSAQQPAGEGGAAAPGPESGFGAGLPPPAAGPGFPAGEELRPTPWEERATRGFFPALFETIKQSMVDPVTFFERMRTDDIVAPIFYYWIVAGFSALVGNLWQALFSVVSAATTPPLDLPADSPLAPFLNSLMATQNNPVAALATAGVGVAFAPVSLFIFAGILHLFAMLFRCANRGFSATLRVAAYAAGPTVLAVVPMCGSMIGGVWYLVLVVIGLWKTQRGTVGGAVGAVIAPIVLLTCC